MKTCSIILAVLLAVPVLAGEANRQARIAFDETVHDFGSADQHTTLRHTFRFRNTGDAPLVISRLRANCGCTVATIARKEFGPGESGDIEATLDTRGDTGSVARSIQVSTNDPDRKTVSLQLKATVAPEILCSPLHLDFGEVTVNGAPELSVQVTSPSGKQFSVEGATASLPFVKTRVDASDNKRVFTVLATITSVPSSGRFSGEIVIQAEMDGPRDLKVVFSGNVPDRTYATPAKLLLGVVAAGSTPSRELRVFANGWEGLRVESVQATGEFSASAEEMSTGREWKVTVGVAGRPAAGLLKGEVRIATNDPLTKEIVVPVSAIIREGE